MNIVWTFLARQRLNEIADRIALDNSSAAEELANRILDRVKALADFPEMGRVVPEAGKQNTRELIEGNYRIIYSTAGEEIRVLTIRHVKQRLPKVETKTHR